MTEIRAQVTVTVDEHAEPGDWLPVLARLLVDLDDRQGTVTPPGSDQVGAECLGEAP